MIVESMSYEDIARIYDKVQKEHLPRLRNRIDENIGKYRRHLLQHKNEHDIFFKRIEIKIDQNTFYEVIPFSHGWNFFQKERIIQCREYLLYINNRGIHAVTRGGYQDDLYLFVTAHFLDRYRERCLSDMTLEKRDVLEEFIKRDSNFSPIDFPLPDKPNNKLCVTDRGVIFIDIITPNILMANTFITKEKLRNGQLDAAAKSEIGLIELERLREYFHF
jgi:hypothetical protein